MNRRVEPGKFKVRVKLPSSRWQKATAIVSYRGDARYKAASATKTVRQRRR